MTSLRLSRNHLDKQTGYFFVFVAISSFTLTVTQLYVEPMRKLNLKLICTTDLHMELFGYDYLMDQPNPDRGLLKLASTIMAHRTGKNSLLFDNGDFLQGTPLADEIAHSRQHLLAEAFNELGYDAITLGNHDFDYGLDALEGFLH